jgi:hypothetical protein
VSRRSEIPNVMRFLGSRERYSRQGGATMPLPRTRIFLISSDAIAKGECLGSKQTTVR